MSLHAGQRIGPYLLQDVLGRGGMAVVWRAWDEPRQRQIAIKVIAEDLLDDAQFALRFLDEARRQARLNHPNIVKVLDTFRMGNQLCMAMTMIVGESLEALLERSPQHRLTIAEACPIFADVLAALDYAHRTGVIHRDVKPSNILLERASGRAFLSDFGIALAIGEARRTRAGVPIGTAEYMSPEQIRDPLHIGHRSDVYSIGCVLYEALTGRPPFSADERPRGSAQELAIRADHINTRPVPPHQRLASIPRPLSNLIMQALVKDPERRLPGCAEFARQLADAVAGLHAATASNSGTAVRRAAVLVLLAAAAALLYVVFHRE